ncbi:MAG: hypothetical protein KBA71_05425 [Opitutaceae bacterium]|nr:hypothetical protein [Opitutaceae bacterium]
MKAAFARFVLILGVAMPGALMAATVDVDRFGGMTTWTVGTSDHFQLKEAHGRWWLITPGGRGMVALGLNHLNELKHPADYSRTLFARRLGTDWTRVFAEVEQQIRQWGFNSAGFLAPPEMRRLMPHVLSTRFIDASFWQTKLTYADVFAPEFLGTAKARAHAAAVEMKGNPLCIAWTWNDSLCWDLALTRKSHGTDFVSFMRGLPKGAPGRIRYQAFLRERHARIGSLNRAYGTTFASFQELTNADWSKLDLGRPAVLADDREFLRLIARQYYQAISTPFRQEYPQGLLMGDRFHLRDHPDEVLEEAAKFIDLLGIQPGDHYQPSVVPLSRPDETWFDAAEFDRLHRLTGKPIVIADHQTGFFDDQTPKTGGWFQYASASEASESYARFLHDAFARPYIVGYFRCQYLTRYHDEARRFKQGLIRPDGTPYGNFVEHLQNTHREVMQEILERNNSLPHTDSSN